MKRWLARLGMRQPGPAVDERLGVAVVSEARYCRVEHAGRPVRLVEDSPQALLQKIRDLVAAAVFPGESAGTGDAPLDGMAMMRLRVAVALHWLGYFRTVGAAPRMTPAELDHPQTWAIVLSHAEDAFGKGSDDALARAGRLLGRPASELATWRRVEDERAAHM